MTKFQWIFFYSHFIYIYFCVNKFFSLLLCSTWSTCQPTTLAGNYMFGTKRLFCWWHLASFWMEWNGIFSVVQMNYWVSVSEHKSNMWKFTYFKMNTKQTNKKTEKRISNLSAGDNSDLSWMSFDLSILISIVIIGTFTTPIK